MIWGNYRFPFQWIKEIISKLSGIAINYSIPLLLTFNAWPTPNHWHMYLKKYIAKSGEKKREIFECYCYLIPSTPLRSFSRDFLFSKISTNFCSGVSLKNHFAVTAKSSYSRNHSLEMVFTESGAHFRVR